MADSNESGGSKLILAGILAASAYAVFRAPSGEEAQRLHSAEAGIGLSRRERKRRRRHGGLGSMKPFDMSTFTFFENEEPIEPPKKSDLFRNANRGTRFEAGGETWEVTHPQIARHAHIVKRASEYQASEVYYAAWENGTITISPVAKRGAFRPVGKALVKERMDGLGAFTSNADLRGVSLEARKTKGKDGVTQYIVEAVDDSGVVGDVHAYHYPEEESDWVEISAASVSSRSRGKGIYPTMLKKLRDFVQEDGKAGVVSRGAGRISPESTASWEKFAKREPRVTVDEGGGGGETDYYLSALPETGRIPMDTVKRALKTLGRKAKACKITPAALRAGMEVEREHRDVTRGGMAKTAKIAAAHLCESPRYYSELAKMERRLRKR